MNKEQLVHYYKGGKFRATYSPKTSDTKDYYKKGRTIEVYQNCLITPIQEGEYGKNWAGQLRFNSHNIYGWFPEEDIENLEIINEFIEYPEKTKKYCYRLTYTKDNQLFPNFGKSNFTLPLTVYREYDEDSDEYIIKLSKPQATSIEKRVVDLASGEELPWKKLNI